jgi:hypothetical protein
MKSDGERGSAVEKVRLKRWLVEKEIKIRCQTTGLGSRRQKKNSLLLTNLGLMKAERQLFEL